MRGAGAPELVAPGQGRVLYLLASLPCTILQCARKSVCHLAKNCSCSLAAAPEQPRGWGPALRGWTGDVCRGCQAAQVLWCAANGGATVVKLYVCHCLDAGSQAATRNPGKLYTP